MFTITPEPGGTITDIAFTNSAGGALDGLDSGLDTLNGIDIRLYTDSTNNNIVLGREGSSSGDIVFALYLEETGERRQRAVKSGPWSTKLSSIQT